MKYDLTKITQIYMGRDRVCRCGCAGEYVERSHPKFERRLKRFAKMWESYEPEKDDVGDNFLNVSYGQDRALCVYFD